MCPTAPIIGLKVLVLLLSRKEQAYTLADSTLTFTRYYIGTDYEGNGKLGWVRLGDVDGEYRGKK